MKKENKLDILKENEKYYGDILGAIEKDISKNMIEKREKNDIIGLLYHLSLSNLSSLRYDMIPENYLEYGIELLKVKYVD